MALRTRPKSPIEKEEKVWGFIVKLVFLFMLAALCPQLSFAQDCSKGNLAAVCSEVVNDISTAEHCARGGNYLTGGGVTCGADCTNLLRSCRKRYSWADLYSGEGVPAPRAVAAVSDPSPVASVKDFRVSCDTSNKMSKSKDGHWCTVSTSCKSDFQAKGVSFTAGDYIFGCSIKEGATCDGLYMTSVQSGCDVTSVRTSGGMFGSDGKAVLLPSIDAMGDSAR